MAVRLHCNQLPTRILGTLTGTGFLAMGASAIFGADDAVAAFVKDRAWWFGVTAFLSFGAAGAFYRMWFISVWCFFAAVLSSIVLMHFVSRRERARAIG